MHRGVFFNDTATTEIYTLSLPDALPILPHLRHRRRRPGVRTTMGQKIHPTGFRLPVTRAWTSRWYANNRNFAGMLRSEEHTSELQSRQYLVCRLLLENKNSLIVEDGMLC